MERPRLFCSRCVEEAQSEGTLKKWVALISSYASGNTPQTVALLGVDFSSGSRVHIQ